MYNIESLLKQRGVYIDNVTIDGKNILLESYLNWNDNYPDAYTYEDEDENTVVVLNVLTALSPKILSKGVFETTDLLTNKTVSIQFYRSHYLEL